MGVSLPQTSDAGSSGCSFTRPQNCSEGFRPEETSFRLLQSTCDESIDEALVAGATISLYGKESVANPPENHFILKKEVKIEE